MLKRLKVLNKADLQMSDIENAPKVAGEAPPGLNTAVVQRDLIPTFEKVMSFG
jgi:hypothetical protein